MSSHRWCRGWRASESPERFPESMETTNELDQIVSEEYDAFGSTKYEIRWSDWRREDGSNTTWHYELKDAPNVIDAWDQRIARRRKQMGSKTRSVEIPDEACPLHQYQTFEFAHALDEKLKRSSKSLGRYANWDALETVADGDRAASSTTATTGNDSDEDEIAEIRRSERVRRMSSLSNVPPKRRRLRSPGSASPRPSPELLPGTSELWSSLCRASGAAGVSIFNEAAAGTESVLPLPLPPQFRYIEGHYLLSAGMVRPDPGFLEMCVCSDMCHDAEVCGCQAMAEANVDGKKTFAYDDKGLLRFDRIKGTFIVECNKGCMCDRACVNRVAQHPRDVPLQIFQTASCGWGVRSTVDLAKGKFVGLYTGLVIRRDDAAKITGEHKSYIFDLDTLEAENDSGNLARYSVDAYNQGNWSRFVNHSCEPNMETYCVVWDTPLSMNRPYLAFFAIRDIPAFTELTLDYDPRAGRDAKGKKVQYEDVRPCMCGADNCRGWIAV